MNTVDKALQARIDEHQHQPLLTAQRLWLQYRDANCASTECKTGQFGKSRQPNARSMTADRARELEKAIEFD